MPTIASYSHDLQHLLRSYSIATLLFGQVFLTRTVYVLSGGSRIWGRREGGSAEVKLQLTLPTFSHTHLNVDRDRDCDHERFDGI